MAQGENLTAEVRSKGGKLSTRSTKIIAQSSQKDLARLAEYGIRNARHWLGKVAEKDPARALSLTIQMLEYVHPKLSRRESVNTHLNIELSFEEQQGIYDSIAENIRQRVVSSTEVPLSE